MGLSRLAEKCMVCPFRDKCDKKRMEAEAYMEPSLSMPYTGDNVSKMGQQMAVRHDYRDIKIDKNTTVTIDLEDVKEQLKKDFYKSVGFGINYGA